MTVHQLVIVIGLSGVQFRSNRASNFKTAERVAQGQYEITKVITSELYNTKFNYYLIASLTKFKVKKSMQFLLYSKR